ncbi:hypothetical protein P4E94_12835 [Pontiellaceae bacterium B12219]|nr:hypothetical protein [Pontiellaceae bacterium B12219]
MKVVILVLGLCWGPLAFGEAWKNVPLPKHEEHQVRPMTGIVLWNDHPESDRAEIQLEYSYMPFDRVAVAQNPAEWDWSGVEARLDDMASHGHQAILRFYYTYPGKPTTVPAYIKALDGYNETTAKSEGKTTGFPDWLHTELKAFTTRFYTEFARRYDADARLAFLQVGFGLWGEYHIYDPSAQLGLNFPDKNYQEAFLRHLDATSTNLCWSISIDAQNKSDTPFESVPELKDLSFGLFDDSFLHKGHGKYNKECFDFFGTAKRLQSPVGGELSYYSDYDQRHALDVPKGPHGILFEDLAADYHVSYLIGNDQPKYQNWDRIRRAGWALGYRFVITSFETSGSSSRVTVENRGIAPFYYDAYIAVNGSRAETTLKGLAPGASMACVVEGDAGSDPVLTIECDRLVKGQRIGFDIR